MRKLGQPFGLLLFTPVLALAQSSGQNYVKTETVLNSSLPRDCPLAGTKKEIGILLKMVKSQQLMEIIMEMINLE